jgi:hypothetical protein
MRDSGIGEARMISFRMIPEKGGILLHRYFVVLS